MTFLELNEVWEWCRTRGVALDTNQDLLPVSSGERLRETFTFGSSSGLAGAEAARVARRCVSALDAWDETLLWITGWGVWPSSEDWPTYYAARGGKGERRSLDVTPGHLFHGRERGACEAFLAVVLANGWDAHLLAAMEGSVHRRAFVSHDQWVQVISVR